jgi:transcriptional regulator with XRE-family HTH domain
MTTAITYGGGWVSRSGTSNTCVKRASFKAMVVYAMVVGTGGLMTADYFAKRADRGYAYHQIAALPVQTDGALQRTPAENLARVREVLKPAVSDLATLFGVSRQAIYDWQAGAQPVQGNAARLDDLAGAADVLAAGGVAATPRLLQRRIAGGKTLFDVVREGASAKEAAHSLAQMLQREHQQRRALDAKLAARRRQPVDYTGAGVPMLDDDTT